MTGITIASVSREGKDTDTGKGKPRDAYLPADVERDLYQFARDEGLDDDDPFVDPFSWWYPSSGPSND